MEFYFLVAWNEIQRKYHHALYFSHQLFFAHTDVLNVKNSFKSMEIYLKYFSPVEGILGSNAFRKTLIYFGIFLAYIFNRVIIPIFMFPIALCIYPFHFVLFACLENILPTILFFLAILVYPFLCILFSSTSFLYSCSNKFKVDEYINRRTNSTSEHNPSTASSISCRDDTSRRFLSQGVQNALEYLNDINSRFRDEPVVYKEFVSLMSKVAAKEIHGNTAVTKIKILLRGHDDLLEKLRDYVKPV